MVKEKIRQYANGIKIEELDEIIASHKIIKKSKWMQQQVEISGLYNKVISIINYHIKYRFPKSISCIDERLPSVSNRKSSKSETKIETVSSILYNKLLINHCKGDFCDFYISNIMEY